MKYKNTERFVADDVSEATWLRLKRLSSSQLCKRVIEKNSPDLAPDIIEKKSVGMSSAVRSAFGYWDTKEGGLNSRILSRYYALLQITIAEQISSDNPKADLSSVQRYTEYGHGLYTLRKNDGSFPDNMMVGCLKSGHFYSYVKSLGFNIKPYADDKKPRSYDNVVGKKTISLSDLLRRVPELQGVLNEYLGSDPLSFQFGHAQKNIIDRSEKIDSVKGNFTFAAIYPHGANVTLEEINQYGFEIEQIEWETPRNIEDKPYLTGKVFHDKDDLWWSSVESYKSGYCGTSIVVPYWGMKDQFVLHLAILYAFSIVVRYLPEVWYEIEHGELDYIRALLEHYLVIVDKVLPKVSVERLTKTNLRVAQPGGMNAPI
nr:hypothetical protein [Halomonas sp. UBA3074]